MLHAMMIVFFLPVLLTFVNKMLLENKNENVKTEKIKILKENVGSYLVMFNPKLIMIMEKG